MWAKRIDETIRRDVLDAIDNDEYVKALRPLLQSKSRSVKGSSDYEKRMKLVRFALGRGFDMETIQRCLNGADDIDEDDGFVE